MTLELALESMFNGVDSDNHLTDYSDCCVVMRTKGFLPSEIAVYFLSPQDPWFDVKLEKAKLSSVSSACYYFGVPFRLLEDRRPREKTHRKHCT